MRKNSIISLLLTGLVAVSSLGIGCGGPKNDESTIEISAYNSGWGLDWLYTAAENFEKTHEGVNVEIVEQDLMGQIANQLKAGPNITTTDIYFANEEINGLLLQGANVVGGYNMAFEPLDEVYDYKPSGDKTVREKCTQGLLDAVTFTTTEGGEEVSHEYVFQYGNSSAGILYNETKFNSLGITLPRTTDELYNETCKQISEKYSNNELTHAAFTDSIRTAYSQYMVYIWWTQYETAQGVKDFWNGIYYKDGIKKYGNKIFEQKGRLYALEAYEKMIGPSHKNAHTNINSMTYMQSQQQFMNGNCLMIVNGNWLENEMKVRAETTTDTIKMMKNPIISEIIEKTPSIPNDDVLRLVVSYVDGEGDLPSGVTETDVEIIRAARDVVYRPYNGGAFIPAYSNAKENAKEFLKYMCSEEYAQIFFEKTGGNNIVFNEDITDFSTASTFIKSTIENQGNTEYITPYRYPLACLGGMLPFPGTINIPSLFAAKNENDRKTPQEIYEKGLAMGTEDYFNSVLKTAGLI